jgi:hypothetical protein
VDSPSIDPGPEALDPLEPPASPPEQPLDPPTMVDIIRDIDFTFPDITLLPWRENQWAIDAAALRINVDGTRRILSLPAELTGAVLAYDAVVDLPGMNALTLARGDLDYESLSFAALGRLMSDSLVNVQTAGTESIVPEPTAFSLSTVMLAGVARSRSRRRVASIGER